MKNTQKISHSLLALFLGASVFFSCQKEEAVKQEIPSNSIQQSEDADDQREATDDAIDIASDAFVGSNMRTAEAKDTCHVDMAYSTNTITLTFNGDNCAGTRKREGSITAKVISAVKWHEQGGILEITFNNYKVTKKSNNKSVTLNGKLIVNNVSGIANPFIETLHGSLSVKFDDGASRNWTVARKRTIAINNDIIQVIIEADSANFITDAGVNREGKEFVTSIPTPVVIQNCSTGSEGFKVIKGEIIHSVNEATLSVEFGYTSLTNKVEDCSATGSVVTYTDATTIAKKYYPY